VPRLVNAPAQVTSYGPGHDGRPWPLLFFTCRGSRFRADLKSTQAEHFVVVPEWWKAPMPDGQPPEAQFYRLPLIGGGVVELVQEPDKSWRLYKVYD